MIQDKKFKEPKIFQVTPLILLILATIIYIVVWSYISEMSILSLQSTYFDLGSFMERLWFIPHYTWGLTSFLAIFSNTGLEFFLFPISYFHNYTIIVVIQSVVIGICALPLYGISRLLIKSKIISLLLAISFLIYFPVAGSNYFNVHFQSFFPFLFISGYYFYLKKNYKLSMLLFFLSGTVRYPYFIFPALFALLGVIETIHERILNQQSYQNGFKRKILYFTIIFIFSVTFLAIRAITAGPVTNIPVSSVAGPYNLWDRTITILMFFGPLLFIPFLSKRWILFFAPMIYLIFFGSDLYYFPMIFHDQYGLFIYPFIYLALIDGIRLLKKILKGKDKGKQKTSTFLPHLKDNDKKILLVIACIFLILILLDTAYEPYGPLNSTSPANYGLNQSLNANLTEFNAVSKVASLIPRNNPYVLTQNNIIEIFPRTEVPPHTIIGLPLIAGMINIGQNLTMNEIAENKIPMNVSNSIIYTNVDFVLADVNSSWYNFNSYGYPSLSELTSELYSSGYYGIRAEDNGVILLQRNYIGKIQFFSGMYLQYLPSQLTPLWHASLVKGHIVVSNSPMPTIDRLSSWYGPYTGLPPGSYKVEFELLTTKNLKNNSIQLEVTEWPKNLAILNITGESFNSAGKVQIFTLNFNTNEFLPYIQFRGVDARWNGNLILYNIYVIQLSS